MSSYKKIKKIPPFLVDPEKPAVRSNISIDYINYKKFKKRQRRMRVLKQRILVGTLVLAVSFGAMVGTKALKHRLEEPPNIVLPPGYMLTTTEEIVQYGDTIYSIAGEYYNEALYSGVYKNIHDYVKAILKQNSLKSNTIIHPGDSISLIAITDLQNEYLVDINLINKEIERIMETELWVQYSVQSGDSYSYLASLVSGNGEEMYNAIQMIKEKNNRKNSGLQQGEIIWIMNPELGNLKRQLREAQQQFQESLKNNNEQKSVYKKLKLSMKSRQ